MATTATKGITFATPDFYITEVTITPTQGEAEETISVDHGGPTYVEPKLVTSYLSANPTDDSLVNWQITVDSANGEIDVVFQNEMAIDQNSVTGDSVTPEAAVTYTDLTTQGSIAGCTLVVQLLWPNSGNQDGDARETSHEDV